MKAISLWQPWATLCAIGAKTFETRGWSTTYRGPLLIHAAQRNPCDHRDTHALLYRTPFYDALQPIQWRLPLGAIVGIVDLVECFRVTQNVNDPTPYLYSLDGDCRDTHFGEDDEPLPGLPEIAFGDFSVGRYAWKLENPRHFAQEIPCRGRQKIFNVSPEVAALARAIIRAMPAPLAAKSE
jgi:hypothetical protein